MQKAGLSHQNEAKNSIAQHKTFNIDDLDSENVMSKDFFKKNSKSWNHFIKAPLSIVEYERSKVRSKNAIGEVKNQDVLVPTLRLHSLDPNDQRVKQVGKVEANSITSEEIESPKSDNSNNDVLNNVKSFSAFGSTPHVFLTLSPGLKKRGCILKTSASIPELCYQTSFQHEDMTYSFGGLSSVADGSFSHLGIPDGVSADKLSVHFPCELPPHVNKDLISNPFMQNFNVLNIFDAEKSSCLYVEKELLGNLPMNLCHCTPTKITTDHVFFFGGFELITVSVEYLEEADRWLIKKDIKMNRNGYIFDLKSLKFVKIELYKSVNSDFEIERIGNGIASNYFDTSLGPLKEYGDESPQKQESDNLINTNFQNNNNLKERYLSESNSDELISFNNSAKNSSDNDTVMEKKRSSDDLRLMDSKSSNRSVSRDKSFTDSIASSQSVYVGADNSVSSKSTRHTNQPLNYVLSKSNRIFHRYLKDDSGGKQASEPSGSRKHYKQKESSPTSNVKNSSPASSRMSPILSKDSQSNDLYAPGEKSNSSNMSLLSGDKSDSCKGEIVFEKEYLTQRRSNKLNLRTHDISRNTENGLSPTIKGGTKDILFESRNENQNQIIMYVFGGFICQSDSQGYKTFQSSNDMIRINLKFSHRKHCIEFEATGNVSLIGEKFKEIQSRSEYSSNWPAPRGYFAYSLVDHTSIKYDNSCQYHAFVPGSGGKMLLPPHKSSIFDEEQGSNDPESFFRRKALFIQGGCNENYETFSDVRVIQFDIGTWDEITTYVYDYFESPLEATADDEMSNLKKGREVSDAKIIEAELRACHHTARYYRDEEHHYILFLGGLFNDYLRHFDRKPYNSTNFDVSRLSKFSLIENNSNLTRILMLDLRTQTWKFVKVYYDLGPLWTEEFKDITKGAHWKNSRVCLYAGAVSLNNKVLTISQGIIALVPEKSSNFEDMVKQIGSSGVLFGGQFVASFPYM